MFSFLHFVCQRRLSFMPVCYDASNDVLLCWIGQTNCQPKWLRTRITEIRHEDKYFESLAVDPIMLEDELWMRQREKQSPNCQSKFLKTELRKLSFQFLNFEFGSVRFVEIYIRHFCRVPHTPTFSASQLSMLFPCNWDVCMLPYFWLCCYCYML